MTLIRKEHTMAISSYKVFLMKGTTAGEVTTYAKLADIKNFPDLGGEPEMLETTTLSDSQQTYIGGIQSMDAMVFDLNYDATVYDTLKALAGTETKYAVWFGGTEALGVVTPTGSAGKFEFSGDMSVFVTGGGVNEVVGMKASIAASTPVVKVAS